ncbi:hypothetical protein [Pelistega europaea]|uniref:Uncharacterized protein n=1 Tax=Pelistega europaea TaxID=106147 RepID=A0A7Y4P608_9BURK|nr:hypothetical protein [Pelistega europaea]NOL50323.1 hypothetical protein [Pelistega europaea]
MTEPTFKTTFSRHLDDGYLGFEVQTQVNDLQLFVCFYIGHTNFELIPSILPSERFDEGAADIHIGELNTTTDVQEELESILSNMNNGDTAVFFCNSEQEIKSALDFLNFAVDED